MSAIMDLPMARGGRIELVTGPMFSGKSTELLRRIRRYRYARKECLYEPCLLGTMLRGRSFPAFVACSLIKFQRDTRYSEVRGCNGAFAACRVATCSLALIGTVWFALRRTALPPTIG